VSRPSICSAAPLFSTAGANFREGTSHATPPPSPPPPCCGALRALPAQVGNADDARAAQAALRRRRQSRRTSSTASAFETPPSLLFLGTPECRNIYYRKSVNPYGEYALGPDNILGGPNLARRSGTAPTTSGPVQATCPGDHFGCCDCCSNSQSYTPIAPLETTA
jgi:hypothetical protein